MRTIRAWLTEHGLPQYIETFEQNAVELNLLHELTELDLEKLGIHVLGQDQGRRDEASQLLKPIYESFTEGRSTRDHLNAKTLLDELGAN